jgi:hypothetical protein
VQHNRWPCSPGGYIVRQRISASSSVEVAIGIAEQGSKTGRGISVADSEAVKRLVTGASVRHPRGTAQEHPNSFAIVEAGYRALRLGTLSLHHR